MPGTFRQSCDCGECSFEFASINDGNCGVSARLTDCDGSPIAWSTDVDGNAIVPICPQRIGPKFLDYTGATPPTDSDCCVIGTDTDGNFAVGPLGCITHVCRSGAWVPMCGQSDVTPTLDQIVYDFSGCTLPLAYGGPSSSWAVGGANRLAGITCSTTPAPDFPDTVLSTCDWSNPSLGNSPATWVGVTWTDTGQGAGASTVVEATGDPADGWACTRPSFMIDFGITAGTGPFSLDLELQDAGGAINTALYDTVNDEYLPITGFTAPACGTAFVANTALGDMLAVLSSSCMVPAAIHIEYANPNGVDASDLRLIHTAVGNYPSANDTERLAEISLTYTPTSTTGDCCNDLNTLAAIALALGANDPNELAWTVSGTTVRATEAIAGQAEQYAALTLCGGCTLTPSIVPT